MDKDQLYVLKQYYQTSVAFLFLTALCGIILIAAGFSGSAALYQWNIAVLHLGIIGALSIGLVGFFLRVFGELPEVQTTSWSLRTILIIIILGVVLLFFGFGFRIWILLTAGLLGTTVAVIWWSVQFVRWYFQAKQESRGGVLLFGLFASLGLVAAVILGGAQMHRYLSNSILQSLRLAHIHTGLIGWASLGLLGIGIAFRGTGPPVTASIGVLKASAWVWFVGLIALTYFFITWNISLVLAMAGVLLLGYLGYGYSMPKVASFSDGDSEKSGEGKRLLPFIIIGVIGLFLTLLMAFDVSASYPSGRAAAHGILGVAGWLLMTFLMAMLSEMPKTVSQLFSHNGEAQVENRPELPKHIRLGWIGLTLGLILALAGSFASLTVYYAGLLIITGTTLLITGYLVRLPASMKKDQGSQNGNRKH